MTRAAFTLIELSIVLVILGLVVGAIVGGKSLIHAAEIQNLVREQQSYTTAYNAFIAQYDTKPGDMRDAWSYFGGGVDTICGDSNPVNGTSCNGNGDGILGHHEDGTISLNELTRAWLHLQLAEILIGKVNYEHGVTQHGRSFPTNRNGVYWNNVPQAKNAEGDAGWNFFNPMVDDGGLGWWASGTIYGKSGAWLLLGGTGFNDFYLFNPVLFPKDASAIDKKLDDGIPTMGNVTSVQGEPFSSSECESSNSAYFLNDTLTPSADHTYTLSYTDAPSCYMLFYIGD